MRRILLIGLIFVFPASGLLAATTDAVLALAQGKVTVKAKGGKKTRIVKKDARVGEGETVVTAKDARATLRLFDGSEIDIKPNTSITLSKLRKPSAVDKIIQFKLAFGGLLAKVQKLLTPASSFEVSAGGVVCGVRGTRFELDYDPDSNHVDLSVLDGTVYTNYNGHTTDYTGGQNAHFPPEHLGGQSGNNQTPGPGNQGPNGQGSLSLDDLDRRFTLGLGINGDSAFTDPSVAGSIRLRVQVNVGPGEAVP